MDTPLLLIPEFVIHETLENALTYIRTDYAANLADTTKSFLYKLCRNAGFQRFIAFDEAVQMICGPDDDPRKLEIELMFNLHKQSPPTIHITMPSEQQQSGGNAIGVDESSATEEFDDVYTDPDDETTYQSTTMTQVFSRRFNTTYNIVITSDNLNQVVFLYHFVRSLLISQLFTMNQKGIQNVSFSGQDIKPYSALVPENLFMRAISMNFQYESKALSFNSALLPSSVDVSNITPIENLEQGI